MDTTTPPPETAVTDAAEDKSVAIVSYLALIGFIVAVIIHSNKKTKLGAFHLRQTIGLFLMYVCCVVILTIPILGVLIFFPPLYCAVCILDHGPHFSHQRPDETHAPGWTVIPKVVRDHI